MLLRTHGHAHVPGRGAQPGGDRLQVQHVVVVQRLDAARHGVAHVEHVVAEAAYAPADFRPVAFAHDAAAAGLFGHAALRVPGTLVDIGAPALVAHREVADFDVAQVAAHQVPFGAVGGAHVPALMDAGGAVGQQGQGDVDVAYRRRKGGGRQADEYRQQCGGDVGGESVHI